VCVEAGGRVGGCSGEWPGCGVVTIGPTGLGLDPVPAAGRPVGRGAPPHLGDERGVVGGGLGPAGAGRARCLLLPAELRQAPQQRLGAADQDGRTRDDKLRQGGGPALGWGGAGAARARAPPTAASSGGVCHGAWLGSGAAAHDSAALLGSSRAWPGLAAPAAAGGAPRPAAGPRGRAGRRPTCLKWIQAKQLLCMEELTPSSGHTRDCAPAARGMGEVGRKGA
jgi:hypothetical protein